MFSRKCGPRNSLIVGILAIAAFIGIGLAASSQEVPSGSPDIDYPGFMELTEQVFEIREGRLVPLSEFNQMAADSETIILDTRSRFAFDTGHVNGAINLPFSDFTDDKLASLIPSKDTRILIYCNNNFTDDVEPIPVKRVELALNIPTFINLYGYGYENLYELGVLTETSNPEVDWVSSFDLQKN